MVFASEPDPVSCAGGWNYRLRVAQCDACDEEGGAWKTVLKNPNAVTCDPVGWICHPWPCCSPRMTAPLLEACRLLVRAFRKNTALVYRMLKQLFVDDFSDEWFSHLMLVGPH